MRLSKSLWAASTVIVFVVLISKAATAAELHFSSPSTALEQQLLVDYKILYTSTTNYTSTIDPKISTHDGAECVQLINLTNHLPIYFNTITNDKLFNNLVPTKILAFSTEDKNQYMSDLVSENNIQFETIVLPNPVRLPIQETNTSTPMQFGVRITNLSSNSYRFSIFYLKIELMTSSGRSIRRDYARNATRYPEASDFPLLNPGENVTFLFNANLHWMQDTLAIDGYDKSGGFWAFRHLTPGIYKVRFTYKNPEGKAVLREGNVTVEDIWTGAVTTPSVELHLTKQS